MIIRRVGVWSVARLYGGISATMGLIIGACFAVVALLGGMVNAASKADSGFAAGGWGPLFGVGAVIMLPIMYGVMGLVGGAIGAALYNLFSGMFGGIEVEVQQ